MPHSLVERELLHTTNLSRQGVLVYFDRTVHHQLRVLAAQRDSTMSAIVRAAIDRELGRVSTAEAQPDQPTS